MKKIRVGITDDHEVIRKGIYEMTAISQVICITHNWPNASETMKGLQDAEIEVLLLDINLPDVQGDVLCAQIKARYPELIVIGLSTFDQSVVVRDFLDAGALGYLTKDASLGDLEEAVMAVVDGKQYLAPHISERFEKMKADARTIRLTRREEDILKHIAQEYTTREIADKLFLSEKTVETHRSHLYQKLGVKNLAGLVREAILRGYVS